MTCVLSIMEEYHIAVERLYCTVYIYPPRLLNGEALSRPNANAKRTEQHQNTEDKGTISETKATQKPIYPFGENGRRNVGINSNLNAELASDGRPAVRCRVSPCLFAESPALSNPQQQNNNNINKNQTADCRHSPSPASIDRRLRQCTPCRQF